MMAIKKTKKKASTKKSTKKPTKRTVKKTVKKPASKAKKKAVKKKTTAKKKATKGAKKTSTKAKKKPTKKTSAKKTTTKAKKKPAKKSVKKTTTKAKNKPAKKIVKKKPVKKVTKKTVAQKPKPKTVKKTLKKAAKPARKAAPQTKPTTAPIHAEQPKKNPLVQEDIHPPTLTVDSSPDEFVNPADLRTAAGAVEFSPYEQRTNENYMDDIQQQHFIDILTKWRGQLMSEVDSTVGHLQQEAVSFPDPLDRAAQEEGFNLELRTRDRERKLIKKIEQSLDDIDKGVYGYCEDCGVEIGIRRLEASPTAVKCIDCKTFSEIRERQEGIS
jgi:DnaK suppressor protein